MNTTTQGVQFLKELEEECIATKKCLERIPENLYEWKPHPKSMHMGYLTLLVAEIPKWISTMVENSEIDFATFTHTQPKNTAEMVKHLEDNLQGAKNALENVSDEALQEPFYLKANGQIIFSTPKNKVIRSTINHLVHHRGQLTVYMRLNDLPVPPLYGPTADEKNF